MINLQRALPLIFLFFVPFSAFAGISLDATRLVFPESNSQQGIGVGVTSTTSSSSPYLVKARVVTAPDAESTDTPFVVPRRCSVWNPAPPISCVLCCAVAGYRRIANRFITCR